MTHQLVLTGNADKFLGELARQQPTHAEAIEDLATEPRPAGCSALKGYPGVLRIRIGGHRVCHTVDDGRLLILVITIGNRSDVYELLGRHLRRP